MFYLMHIKKVWKVKKIFLLFGFPSALGTPLGNNSLKYLYFLSIHNEHNGTRKVKLEEIIGTCYALKLKENAYILLEPEVSHFFVKEKSVI